MSGQEVPEEDRAPGVTPAAPWRVAAIAVLPGYRMEVEFRDGTRGVADFSTVVRSPKNGIFAALANPEFFARATVECGAITWPNGADMDPAWMHESIRASREWSVPD